MTASNPSCCIFQRRAEGYDRHETLKVFLFGAAGTAPSLWLSGKNNPLESLSKEDPVDLFPIRLPGREYPPNKDAQQFDENGYFNKTISSFAESIVLELIHPEVAPKGGPIAPFALIGVSLGSWIALEVAQKLSDHPNPIYPKLLWLGNLLPPTSAKALHNKDMPVKSMDDEQLLQYTLKWGAKNLEAHWGTFKGIVKSDMALLDEHHESYQSRTGIGKEIKRNVNRIILYYAESDEAYPRDHDIQTDWNEYFGEPGAIVGFIEGENHSWLCNGHHHQVISKYILPHLEHTLLEMEYDM